MKFSPSPDILQKYFPHLSPVQVEQFTELGNLYGEWNEKINVISRKDIEALYERHVLHSLAIAKITEFPKGTKILDVGTGGGFPGIPLAILFAESDFHLVDSIGKKIKVVNAVKDHLGLQNVLAEQQRAEKVEGKYHFIVSRAVTRLSSLVEWGKGKFRKDQSGELPNGWLCLKGGDVSGEVEEVRFPVKTFEVGDYFKEEFFETKKIVYVKR